MLRSIGAILFGIAADRYGRKWPFVVNNLLFIVLELVSSFSFFFISFASVNPVTGLLVVVVMMMAVMVMVMAMKRDEVVEGCWKVEKDVEVMSWDVPRWKKKLGCVPRYSGVTEWS